MKEIEASNIINKQMIFKINDGTTVAGMITGLRKCDAGTYAMIKSDSVFKEGWYRLDTIISYKASQTTKKKMRKGNK